MNNETYYAVAQANTAICGVGRSENAAIGEANEWLDDPVTAESLEEGDVRVDGDLVLVECTSALFDLVESEGGDVHFTIRGGVAMTADEADADAQ